MYYVYELIDPRNNQPFYVGKGTGRRAKTHLWEVPETRNQHKENKIAAIRQAGMEPEIKYIVENINDEKLAYDIETLIIKKYGRKGYDKDGILTNICEDARPPNHKGKTYEEIYGLNRAKEQREKRAQLQKDRGGYGPKKHSAKTKELLSEKSSRENNSMYGKKHTQETIEKIKKNRQPASGSDHWMAKHWVLTDPSGIVYETNGNLEGLCERLNISYATMYAAYTNNRVPNRGISAGWKITRK
jgi:hypothetical protein